MKISRAHVARMVQQADRDGSGEIEFPEFVELMTSKLGRAGGAVQVDYPWRKWTPQARPAYT